MTRTEIELKPCDLLTTDAIGKPGKRVFYLQGSQGQRVVTLLVEKVQIQTMALGVEQFLAEIMKRYPDLPPSEGEYREEVMKILPPVDPLFRVGDLGLAYDHESDLAVLVAREVVPEGGDAEETGVVRFWCTRSQIRSLSQWALVVASRGRPVCPYCGEPMEPEGHFCPKKNGHKH
jgi:uncharacterized repeat protein (TIGR03847 family)